MNHETTDRLLSGTGKTLSEYQQVIDRDLTSVATPLSFRLRLDLQVRTEAARGVNIMATLPGSDPDLRSRYVVLSAHYDHVGVEDDTVIYHGADDNASGTAAVMAVARAFSLGSTSPKRSLLFLLVSGEEKGLLGSKYFVNHSPIPIDRFSGEINLDMVGRNAPDSIYVIGAGALSEDLETITNNAVDHVAGLHLNYRYTTDEDPHPYYYRSDHYSFAKLDIPSVFFFAGIHDDYHKPADTPEKLNYRKIAKVAKLSYLTAKGIANLPRELRLRSTISDSTE